MRKCNLKCSDFSLNPLHHFTPIFTPIHGRLMNCYGDLQHMALKICKNSKSSCITKLFKMFEISANLANIENIIDKKAVFSERI